MSKLSIAIALPEAVRFFCLLRSAAISNAPWIVSAEQSWLQRLRVLKGP